VWAKRVGAIVLAAALIAGGLLVRRLLDGDDEGAGAASEGGGPSTVVCIPELESACRELATADDVQLIVEDAGATYERVAADAASAPDAWITLHPWPEMARRAATLGGGDDPFPTTVAIAHGPFAAVGRTARWNAMAEHCGEVTWRCIGEVAGHPWTSIGGDQAWGVIKPSHADAARSASGLLSFAVIVSDYWGSTDFTGTDLQNDDAFLSWLSRLEAAVPTYGDAANTPLDILLAQPRIDIVQTTAAEVDEKAGTQRDELATGGPTVPVAEVVVAGEDADAVGRRLLSLESALAPWTYDPDGEPTEPSGTGLPSADVMIALRDLWQGVARR
jgi:hypothetical protein